MKPPKKRPWAEFAVGIPGSSECVPLKDVFHVAHFDAALSILKRGGIRPGLICDRSILNTHRILVSWVSPNDWSGAGGFRYGNVRFAFDWKSLIARRAAYWVESIGYGVAAARILISDAEHAAVLRKLLVPYDPTERTGPWWRDPSDDSHWWNGQFCLEIMVESHLLLSSCVAVDFVKHHENRCSISPSSCPDRGVPEWDAGALFLAAIVGSGGDVPNTFWRREEIDATKPMTMLKSSTRWLLLNLESSVNRYDGSVTSRSRRAQSLARAILDRYARPATRAEVGKLGGLFATKRDMVESVLHLIADWSRARIQDLRP